MCNLAPADISKQIPAWSLMTSAYLFRDSDHLKKTFKSDVGQEFIKMARDQLGIQVITPVYFGARHVNLKPDKKIKTPADLAGIKLRMPPGEFWQFLGESIGANPTPVAYAEVYTALQTGAIDGQDNPLVASRLMKFYEVTSQFVLTGHVIGYDVMVITTKVWDAMKPAQQAKFQAAAEKAIDEYTAKYDAQEKEAIEFFKKRRQEGLHAGPDRLPHLRAEEVRSTSTAAIGRRARSSASTPSSRLTEPQAAGAIDKPGRRGCSRRLAASPATGLLGARSRRMSSMIDRLVAIGALAAPARRERRGRAAAR